MTHLHVSAGTAQRLAEQALKARLFNPNGAMKHWLKDVAAGHRPGSSLAILSDDEQRQHGVSMILDEGIISVYVRPEFRGNGWGEKLVQMVKIIRPNQQQQIYALPSENTPRGVRFWEKCRVEVRDHGLAPAMTPAERDEFARKGGVLIVRDHAGVPMNIFETLYIRQLYGDEYSEYHDGIRGKLACVFEENLAPFDWVLFHYSGEYESCALITERDHLVEGNTTRVVELQLYVQEQYRRAGLGQEIIDRAQALYPGRTLFGYHTDTSHRLLKRNGVLDLRREP